MAILSPTNLETTYGVENWVSIYNKNVDLLNSFLLYLDNLQDVHIQKKEDDAVLMWKSAISKFVAIKYD
jgi:hypothetical protein